MDGARREGYDAMTNLPQALRETLADEVPFSTLAAETEQRRRTAR